MYIFIFNVYLLLFHLNIFSVCSSSSYYYYSSVPCSNMVTYFPRTSQFIRLLYMPPHNSLNRLVAIFFLAYLFPDSYLLLTHLSSWLIHSCSFSQHMSVSFQSSFSFVLHATSAYIYSLNIFCYHNIFVMFMFFNKLQ